MLGLPRAFPIIVRVSGFSNQGLQQGSAKGSGSINSGFGKMGFSLRLYIDPSLISTYQYRFHFRYLYPERLPSGCSADYRVRGASLGGGMLHPATHASLRPTAQGRGVARVGYGGGGEMGKPVLGGGILHRAPGCTLPPIQGRVGHIVLGGGILHRAPGCTLSPCNNVYRYHGTLH